MRAAREPALPNPSSQRQSVTDRAYAAVGFGEVTGGRPASPNSFVAAHGCFAAVSGHTERFLEGRSHSKLPWKRWLR